MYQEQNKRYGIDTFLKAYSGYQNHKFLFLSMNVPSHFATHGYDLRHIENVYPFAVHQKQ